jgi:hypothetical protein
MGNIPGIETTDLPPKNPPVSTDFPDLSEVESISEHKCSYCDAIFTRKDTLQRHTNERCKVKKDSDSAKEDIFMKLLKELEMQKQEIILIKEENKIVKQLKEENIELKKQLTNIIPDRTTNNIDKQVVIDKQQIINNNNVKLIAFGQEDMSYITDNICKQILSKGFSSVPKLIEHVHFNKDKPEYHNVYIPNFKNSFAMVFDGGDWCLRDRDDIIGQLKDDKTEFISGKFAELLEAGELSEATIKKLKRFLAEKDEDPADTNIKNDIKLILYNRRNLVLNSKKRNANILKHEKKTALLKH